LKPEDEYIAAGDEVVVSKAGKETYGLDRFFLGIQQGVISSLSFFAFSLVNVREERQKRKTEDDRRVAKTRQRRKA
jgi:hypothetical protein